MHYHLIGICGVSMSGIAKLLQTQGHKVTGSDINKCQISNVKCQIGHSAKNITKDIDEVIYTKAIDNPTAPGFVELKKAQEFGIKCTPRAKFLGRLMNNKIGISVTGMHGKTTVTTMISLILEAAGFNPTCLVGSEVKEWGSNVRIGGKNCHSEPTEESLSESDFSVPSSILRVDCSSRNDKGKDCFAVARNDRGLKFGKLTEYFVVETDESAKQMLDFRPKIAVITNLEEEHLDTYKKGMKDIRQAFKKFIRLLPSNGHLVVWQEDKNLMPLTKAAKCKVKRVSLKKSWPGLNLKIPGKFNLLNATFSARVCHELGVDHKTIKKVLNDFTGAARRFEIKGEKKGVLVIDDYGHHPTEIKNAIGATREYINKIPNSKKQAPNKFQISNSKFETNKLMKLIPKKLIMVFQPHQQQRTKLLFNDFVKTFDGVDELIITDVYLIAGREKDTDENLAKKLVEEIKKRNVNVKYIESVNNYQKIIDHLRTNTKKGDLVITQGATDIYKVGEELLK